MQTPPLGEPPPEEKPCVLATPDNTQTVTPYQWIHESLQRINSDNDKLKPVYLHITFDNDLPTIHYLSLTENLPYTFYTNNKQSFNIQDICVPPEQYNSPTHSYGLMDTTTNEQIHSTTYATLPHATPPMRPSEARDVAIHHATINSNGTFCINLKVAAQNDGGANRSAVLQVWLVDNKIKWLK